jgi:hypothetical protein
MNVERSRMSRLFPVFAFDVFAFVVATDCVKLKCSILLFALSKYLRDFKYALDN